MALKMVLRLAAALGLAGLGLASAGANGLSVEQKAVSAGGRSFRVSMVRVPLSACRVKVGLARGRVGATAPLESIARQYGAVAAINGCFFSAYIKDAIKPPYHHLITGGQLVHHGNTGTTIGFDGEGSYRMDRVEISISGELDGRTAGWYAYRVNHPLESASSAGVYNRLWAGAKTPAAGGQVVVRDGKVVAVGTGSQTVPADGYVLLFAGAERSLANRFQVGQQCSFKVAYGARDPEFWGRVQEGLGCGPRLVAQGQVAVDPTSEGFSSHKILTDAGQRSAVGVTRDGTLLLVTCGGATIRQMAGVMRALGAYDAMNLDGGASSCLWAQGRYLARPGRDISNALLILRR